MSIIRIVLLAVWIFAALAVFLPLLHPAPTFGRWLAGLLLGAHALECLLFWRRLRAAPGSFVGHLGSTLLFGLFHLRRLPR